MTTEYDAIVVGARCAGAPTAMLLARRGHRVLLVDRAPSSGDAPAADLVHPPGVAALRRWGLLDEVVASGCPAIETYAFDPGPLVLTGRPLPSDGVRLAYAPRGAVLDEVLAAAAARAGVEVRDRFPVDDLVVEDGTVVGVRGRSPAGGPTVERARIVIGADGRDSLVAGAAGAERYADTPVLSHVVSALWSGLPVDGVHLRMRDDRAVVTMPTNDGLTLVRVVRPRREAPASAAEVAAAYMAAIEGEPELAERIGGATREEPIAGDGLPNVLRRPFGPGWALVGDAGYSRDAITFQGVNDAFRDAELCATAVDEALDGRRPYDEAMAAYHRTRDEQVMPIFGITTHLAGFEPPEPGLLEMLAAVHGNQEGMDAFVSVIAGTSPPSGFVETARRLIGSSDEGRGRGR
jgi:2-polyprenyl-6-methoxyphenol hydroxylase-like FAD-dependent oxidoreductase